MNPPHPSDANSELRRELRQEQIAELEAINRKLDIFSEKLGLHHTDIAVLVTNQQALRQAVERFEAKFERIYRHIDDKAKEQNGRINELEITKSESAGGWMMLTKVGAIALAMASLGTAFVNKIWPT